LNQVVGHALKRVCKSDVESGDKKIYVDQKWRVTAFELLTLNPIQVNSSRHKAIDPAQRRPASNDVRENDLHGCAAIAR